MRIGKKAVSPLISTVLLIMIVIVLAIIILLWARGFIQEAVTKEIGGSKKRVNEYCLDIQLAELINEDESFGIENRGNVPLYGFKLKTSKGGSSDITRFDDGDHILNPGHTLIIEDVGPYYSYDSIKIIPILLGETNDGNSQPFDCPEENGFDLKI
jgi:flagellin-like protein